MNSLGLLTCRAKGNKELQKIFFMIGLVCECQVRRWHHKEGFRERKHEVLGTSGHAHGYGADPHVTVDNAGVVCVPPVCPACGSLPHESIIWPDCTEITAVMRCGIGSDVPIVRLNHVLFGFVLMWVEAGPGPGAGPGAGPGWVQRGGPERGSGEDGPEGGRGVGPGLGQ